MLEHVYAGVRARAGVGALARAARRRALAQLRRTGIPTHIYQNF